MTMLNSIVIAGEGKADMGCCINQQLICKGGDFETGAVTKLLLKLICHHLPEQNTDYFAGESEAHLTFIYRKWFGEQPKSRLSKIILPSKRLRGSYLVRANEAAALAIYAKKHGHQMAAYFHDTDHHDWKTLCHAIKEGFRAAEFIDQGIAVVPNPESEIWFIAGIEQKSFKYYEKREQQLSGNDKSPNSAKAELKKLIGNCDNRSLCDLVETLDVTRIDMPSFNELRQQVKTAITALCGECRD